VHHTSANSLLNHNYGCIVTNFINHDYSTIEQERQKKHLEQACIVPEQSSQNLLQVLMYSVEGSISQSERNTCRLVSVSAYSTETLALNVDDMARFERTERMMVR